MTKTRRDFIKATATVSLIGISEASAKPRNKYKKGGGRTKTVTVHKVCVVSSIPFAGTKFETQFKAGLGGNITYKTPKDGKGYDLTTLQQAISDAGSDGDTLVVTAGGLVVAQAAKGLAGSIPYISLVGGTDNFETGPNGKFKGGHNLKSYDDNLARIAALSAIASPNEICLLHNTKSAMTAREQADFANKQPVTIDQSNAANAHTIYDSAFNAIKMNMTSVKAVIISADPWFLATRQDLVNAGNASTFHVCYPLKEYKTETNPKPKHSRIHAPKERLDGAYKLLGSRAKDYINDNSKMTFDDAQLDVPDPLP